MKKKLLASIFFTVSIYATSSFATISWDNPPVLCPEEVFPKGLDCLDLSLVKNPLIDFPEQMSKAEILEWKNIKNPDLKLCRFKEILKRETEKPQSFSAGILEQAWMTIDGAKNVKEKLEAVDAATKKFGIPPQVLLGAMKQESALSSLGISPDGGNYSCGMSQLNIQEWCHGMNRLTTEEKARLGWPSIECNDESLPSDIVKPFYDIAIKNAGNRPSYQLNSADFQGITANQTSSIFRRSKLDDKRFLAISSFVNNCQNIFLSVSFKAQNLKNLFNNFVPKALRNAELYPADKTFPRTCQTAYGTNAYPLHTGWLLAVAMYNAGPTQAKVLEHYYQVKNNEFPNLTPLDLIEALHSSGKYKRGKDSLQFKDQNGDKFQQSWFKSCIVQRHIARVIQHVTVFADSIAKSLDREGCKTTGVPDYRQEMSGVK